MACNHEFCKKNLAGNELSIECVGFNLIDLSNINELNVPSSYKCTDCRDDMKLLNNETAYFCQRCEISFCAKCKKAHQYHEESCIDNPINYELICPCGNYCFASGSNLFYQCESCSFRCLVCFNYMKFGHLNCAKYLQSDYRR